MKKVLFLMAVLALNACTTKYILMDENGNPVQDGYYTQNTLGDGFMAENAMTTTPLSGTDVFVVSEGADYVTYQYKNVRVDEISPLASLYCADVSYVASPYLREVSMYHNGFMRATFDCVNIAI
jgi:hypothetical protein